MLPALFSRSFARRFVVFCAAFLTATAAIFGQTTSAFDGFDPNVDGNVYAVAVQADGKTIIAGQFATIQANGLLAGTGRNNIARLNRDGTLDATFNPDVDAPIRALIVQPNRQILIGGDFTKVGNVTRNRVARLNEDGSVDATFDPNVTGPILPQVHALALQADGAVVVGGFFASVQPAGAATATPRRNLARFTSAGALDTAWNPNPNGIVLALRPHVNNTILVGGGFTTFQENGSATVTTRNRLARLNANGTLDTTFDQDANNAVQSFAIQRDGKILVGGSFTTLKNGVVHRIGRLNVNGTIDTSFTGGASGQVKAIAVQPDGGILIGGAFFSLWTGGTSPVNRSYLARFNPDGTVDAAFAPSFNSEVVAIAIQSDAKVVVGGYFTRAHPPGSIAVPVRNRVARINPNGTLDATFELNTGGRPLASFVQTDGKIVIGGTFTNVGGATHTALARLNADGSVDSGFNAPVINGSVFALIGQADGKLVIAGTFTRVGGEKHERLARINPDGSVDNTFKMGANGTVTALARQSDGAILAGGTFTTVQNADDTTATQRNNLVRLNGSTGAIDTTFNVNTDGGIFAIVVQSDGKIVIGGNFTVVQPNGTTQFSRSRIARLNADGSLDTNFNPGFNEPVITLALQKDNKLLVGGSFTQAAGNAATASTARNRIARVNTDGTLDMNFDPNANGNVLAITVQANDQILVGGVFTTLQPAGDTQATERNYLARLTPEGKIDTTFNLNLETRGGNRVDSITLADSRILVGGNFASLQPNPAEARTARPNFVRVESTGAIDRTFELGAVGGTTAAEINSIVLQSDGKVVAAGSFSDLGGADNNDIARFHPEGAIDASFSSALAADGAINAVAVRTNSTALVGQLNGFAWLNANGGLRSSFAPSAATRFTGEINVAAIDRQGRLLLGGLFSNSGTSTASVNLVRFNADGTLDGTFTPVVNDRVTKIVVQPDNDILIVGNFTTVNTTARRRIARLNDDGTLDTGFDPNPDAAVHSIVLQSDGKIVIGGDFRSLTPNSATAVTGRNYLARLESSGSVEASFNPNPNGAVYALALQSDNKLVLGGGFTTLQPGATGTAANRPGIARVNADGTLDSFNPKSDGAIYSLAIQSDGAIVVGGEFSTLTSASGATVTRNFLGRFTSSGDVDLTFDPNPNGAVTSLAVEANNSILLSGFFSALQPGRTGATLLRDRLARVSSAGVVDPAFNPDFVGSVFSADVSPANGVLVTGNFTGLQPNGLLVVGGAFANIGGIPAERLALLADDGSVNGMFQPKPNAPVHAVLALPTGGFLVGGEFTNIAGTARSYLARFNADNTLDTSFVPTLAGAVGAFALQPDGKILVALRALAPVRLNSNGSTDASFNAGAVGGLGVRAIALQPDGKIIVLENATQPSGDRVLRLNADGSRDDTYTAFSQPVGSIRTLALQSDGALIVGRGAPLFGVTRLLANGAIDPLFSAPVNSSVNAVAIQADGRVLIGGSFTRVGELTRIGLARISASGLVAETIGVTADRSTVIWSRSGPAAELATASFELSTDANTWTSLGQGSRMGNTANWQLTGQSLPASGMYYIRARGIAPSSGGKSSGLHEIVRQISNDNPVGIASSDAPEVVANAVTVNSAGFVTSVPPAAAGVYFNAATPSILGVASSSKVIGAATQVGANIIHPNGNIYDQILLEGGATTVTADPGQVVRVSFEDYTKDIVQVEFAGAGSLTIVLNNASAPAPAENYNQPGVSYVRGHAAIIIVGANETTNVSVFSVGRLTALNQSLFRDDVTYDGVADLAYLAISSTDGKFGSIRTGNVNYFATQGLAGIYAPGVHFSGAVNVGDINGYDSAVAMLVIGSAAQTSIAGGDLWQQNGHAVTVSGISALNFVAGTTSHGRVLPAQSNRAPLEENEVDVTARIVVQPSP